jgi:hypothetical protein
MTLEAWGDDGDHDGLDDMRDAYRQSLLEDGWLDDAAVDKLTIALRLARRKLELYHAVYGEGHEGVRCVID